MIKLIEKSSIKPSSMKPTLRVLVVTSCTGSKRSNLENQLSIDDFKDTNKLKERENLLLDSSFAAGQMYTGMQHLQVMEAVNSLRTAFGKEAIDLKIVSAGYGLISEDKVIAPYSVTFNSMNTSEIDSWATHLKIHKDFNKAVIGYNLVFVLLGDKYLRAINLPVDTDSNQTFIFLASNNSRKYIDSGKAKSCILTFDNYDASRFSCALVGLKGHILKLIASQISKTPNFLEELYQNPEVIERFLEQQPQQLEIPLGVSFEKKIKAISKNNLFKIKTNEETLKSFLELPKAKNTHLKMQYFIPEWDDKIDQGYDFINEKFSQNRNAYKDDIYSHEIYSKPNYCGILVSKVNVEKKASKQKDIEEVGGIQNFIRFNGEVMGDCGAFGYIQEEEPPYNTDEIIDYYQRLKFDYGVSIDHLIVGKFAQPGIREKRYDLTIKNAEEFIQKHQQMGCDFTPIGVAQGWNPQKYADAVKLLVNMGYEYIAIGGVARTPTLEILEILKEVSQHLTPETRLHLFGVGRTNALPYFRHLGVTSFDSASPLRKAWFDAKENYHTLSGKTYAAIRIPFVDKPSVRIKYLLENGYTRDELKKFEQDALNAIRDYDKGNLSVDEALEQLLAYDKLLELPRNGKVDPSAAARRLRQHSQMYKEALEAKPWKECGCEICKQVGVESIIFRGNDRNRRRGFHNTYVFYQRFEEFLDSQNLADNADTQLSSKSDII